MAPRLAATLLGLAVAAGLAGCVTLPGPPPRPVELAAVPFFPQEQYQCGPAALATVLTYSGVPVTPEALVPQVYSPARQGSLQADLIGATRRHGRLPWLVSGDPAQLDELLAEGRPVLVLQNLGSRGRPLWHYAVVVGREVSGHYLLRSGITPRQRLPARRFLATWARADAWAMVALPPDEIPHGATPRAWTEQGSALLHAGQGSAALSALRAGVARWPGDALMRLALSEAQLAMGSPREAEASLEAAVRLDPRQPAARNNYAVLLAARGCRAAAETHISQALELARGTPFEAEVRRSVEEIRASTATATDCPPPEAAAAGDGLR